MTLHLEDMIPREKKSLPKAEKPFGFDDKIVTPRGEHYEDLPFGELIQQKGGVEYFLDHAENYRGLSSIEACELLSVMTPEQLPGFVEAAVCFESLGSDVFDALINYGCFQEMAALRGKLSLLNGNQVIAMINDGLCLDEDFENLIPRMQLPVSDEVILEMIRGDRDDLFERTRDKLRPGLTEDKLRHLCIMNNAFKAYYLYLNRKGYHYPDDESTWELLKQMFSADGILDEILADFSEVNLIDYLSIGGQEMTSSFPLEKIEKILKKCIGKDASIVSDLILGRGIYFHFTDDNKFFRMLIKNNWTDIASQNIDKFSDLDAMNLELLLKSEFSSDVLMNSIRCFASGAWTKNNLMLLMERRKSEPFGMGALLYAIMFGTMDGDDELAEAMINVGWGAEMINLFSNNKFRNFYLTPNHLDRMLDIYSEQKKIYDDELAYFTRPPDLFGSQEAVRPLASVQKKLFAHDRQVDDYLVGLANIACKLPFNLTLEQAECMWTVPRARNEMITNNVRRIDPAFFTTERLMQIISITELRQRFIKLVEHLHKVGVELDGEVFVMALNHIPFRAVWSARQYFANIHYDNQLAEKIMEKDGEYELLSAIDEFEPFENEQMYIRFFDRCLHLSGMTLELIMRVIHDRFPGRMKEILQQIPMDIQHWGVKGFKRKWKAMKEEEVKPNFVLSRLLGLDSFQAVADWLQIFDQPAKNRYVKNALNERLVALATQGSWYDAAELLAVMNKYKISIDKRILIDNLQLVKRLSVEGQIVTDPEDQKMIGFLFGMNHDHPGVRIKLKSLKQKDVTIDKVLLSVIERQSAIERNRRQTRENRPIYEGKPLNVTDQAIEYYLSEYVRTVADQISDYLAAAGQELSFEHQCQIGEITNHDKFALWLRDYLVTIIDGELKYGRTSGKVRINMAPDVNSIDNVKVLLGTGTTEELLTYLDRAEADYLDGNEWSEDSYYGGKSWAEVVKWTKRLILAMNSHDGQALRHAIDTIFSLHHNTDSVFNKNLRNLIKGDHSQLKKVLDLKFKQPKLMDATIDLIRLASSVEIRSAVNRILTILKDLPGYDYSAHSIRADINWSMVRGAKPRGD